MGTNPREELLRILTAARDQAKTILATLEQQGHPQTNESNGVYFGLVTILILNCRERGEGRRERYSTVRVGVTGRRNALVR